MLRAQPLNFPAKHETRRRNFSLDFGPIRGPFSTRRIKIIRSTNLRDQVQLGVSSAFLKTMRLRPSQSLVAHDLQSAPFCIQRHT
jgi:hypothetical protein